MMTKSAAFVLALCCLAAIASAQGVRYDSSSLTVNNSCISGALCPILAVPGTTVQFCASYLSCNSPGTTYTDSTLATTCPSNAPVTLPGSTTCQTTVGTQGQFGFWVAASNATPGYKLTPPTGSTVGPYPFSAAPITPNYITTESGANNAIVGTLAGAPALADGLTLSVLLAHSLQAGANTFAYAGGSAVSIKSHRNTANNIGTAYVSGGTINLQYNSTATAWLDLSQ